MTPVTNLSGLIERGLRSAGAVSGNSTQEKKGDHTTEMQYGRPFKDKIDGYQLVTEVQLEITKCRDYPCAPSYSSGYSKLKIW